MVNGRLKVCVRAIAFLGLVSSVTVSAAAPPAKTGLDNTLRQENKQLGVTRPALSVVDDLAYLRKVSIDLVGRIPTEVEIQQYLTLPSETRRASAVERLLADPRFVDRWTIFFGDMLRLRSNAEGGASLTAFVHRAIEKGMPYDELCRRLISAGGKSGAVPEVGFILGDNADPMALAGVTSQIFMGVRISCAECHDHPFDKWTREDFYGFAAFFGKTRRVQRRFQQRTLAVYTTEVDQTTILWPPQGVGEDADRKPMKPKFPIGLARVPKDADFIVRLMKLRAGQAQAVVKTKKTTGTSVDDLLANAARKAKKQTSGGSPDLLGVDNEAKKDVKNISAKGGYRPSDLRIELARMITHPRNPYFARAFVNRMWAEIIGRGFVEPIDDFTDDNKPSHPQTLDYLSHEFVASGYDIKSLLRTIVTSQVYQRGHASSSGEDARVELEAVFLATPVRRMISESLFDSIVVAGHLFDVKHEAGKNLKTVWRQSRVMKQPETIKPTGLKPQTLAGTKKVMPAKPKAAPAPRSAFDIEKAIEVDFDSILAGAKKGVMIDKMQAKSAEELEAERMQQQAARLQADYIDRFVRSVIDDNPRFSSAARMAAPAPDGHFVRVFGQPARVDLGDFRDGSATMRQALLMLNGRLTHEASRVGELELLHPLLVGKKTDLTKAVRLAYREILTREPTQEEIADATAILKGSKTTLNGMADLRWVLLNGNEFRHVP
jgi:hypothetical protein